MSNFTEVAIVGAGPYGLSIAAHLRESGIPFRIFGKLMYTWREQMPEGMMLKSDGFASNLSDPSSIFTLEKFCAERNIPYDHEKIPVSLETFVSYGDEFQRRMVPELDDRFVTLIEEVKDGFRLTLEGGETVSAKKVVVAVGITHFAYLPQCFRNLDPAYVTHSSVHKDPKTFAGRKVAVVGSGASALDLAALLKDGDADVSVYARRSAVRFHDAPHPGREPLWQRLRSPRSGVGPGWKARFVTDMPQIFYHLPSDFRVKVVKRFLGPSAGWTVRKGIEGRVPVHTGMTPQTAEIRNGKVHLTLKDKNGKIVEEVVDHCVVATGYRVDVNRLKFLSPSLATKIKRLEDAPILSPGFESSVHGLYFTGVSAAFSFGPVMRFAFGSRFTAFRVTKYLARGVKRQPVASRAVAATS
ncbi:NAD(P)-binding domain-containing protein [Silvibacterium acidisoli]|uniref:NAD(P)-binding domain-containing protein n=1 Tax=Acidobacteriaceae bacterium ZG23-2 TaxID=2883246 RepID=UPI00406CA4FB